MGVSKNRGTPKSSILIGFSIIFTIHFGGKNSYFWLNTHMHLYGWETLKFLKAAVLFVQLRVPSFGFFQEIFTKGQHQKKASNKGWTHSKPVLTHEFLIQKPRVCMQTPGFRNKCRDFYWLSYRWSPLFTPQFFFWGIKRPEKLWWMPGLPFQKLSFFFLLRFFSDQVLSKDFKTAYSPGKILETPKLKLETFNLTFRPAGQAWFKVGKSSDTMFHG